MRPVLSLAVLVVLGGLTPPARLAAQPKLPNLPPDLMAPTDPLSPADERKQFTVPAGFEVQLVASEPEIQKPIQMAFDAKGRLWVTTSYHYPFAAPGKASDKLFVLSDFDPATGKARKVETFADDLNIPIGILPLPDCKSCIVSSVSEIRKYTDTKGTGKADTMEVLYKGFGSRDTHGMYNSFTLMPDGWVYACHGFNNDSTVKGKDGHEVKMQSGNTFRFRPDGSRIEVWTRGQVNPFGMAVDPWFNMYTADCHSKPITQLIPGGYYDSFGKPHDGLGFAPHVTAHPHKSTGLCGLVWYDADQFPKEYKGTMMLGDVVSNCISADLISWKGASPVAKELPDFMTSKDRWFRPVDIKLAPDGSLYVADFYNKIIGHYEVSLTDPRRDKDRGRVWRIVWKGTDGKAPAPKPAYTDLTKEKPEDLAKLLASPNLMVRMMATNECLQRNWDEALSKAITKVAVNQAQVVAPHFLWIAERKGEFKTPEDMSLLGYAAIAGTKGEAGDIALPHNMFRPLISRDRLSDGFRKHVLAMTTKLWEQDKFFKEPVSTAPSLTSLTARVFAELAARHPHADFVPPLIEVLKKCDPDDTHLRMAAKIALRNCLVLPEVTTKGLLAGVIGKDEKTDIILAESLLGGRDMGTHLFVLIAQRRDLPEPMMPTAAEFVGRYADTRDRWKFAAKLPITPGKADRNAGLMVVLFRGMQAQGAQFSSGELAELLTAVRAVLQPVKDNPQAFKSGLAPAQSKEMLGAVRLIPALQAVSTQDNLARADNGELSALLSDLAHVSAAPVEFRLACTEANLAVAPKRGYEDFRKLLTTPDTPAALREQLLLRASLAPVTDLRLDARDGLKEVPYRVAIQIATNLAGTKDGAELLLVAVKEGKAPQRLLQEKAILERLKGSNPPGWEKAVADLTKNLPPADQRIADLIKKRATGFASAKVDKAEGAKLFTKHCAACHRVGDVGGKIAPQLDGVGVRGVERLLEDVLDPNRNVDQAFRARSITLTNDKTLTALMLRVEGKVLVVADLEGKEQRIPLDEIATNRETMLSAMPANFDTVVPEADLYNIIAYLLDQKAKDPPPKK